MIAHLATTLYALASLWQGRSLFGKRPAKWVLWSIGLPAVVLHAYLLYQWIDVGFGQNLYLFNVLSLIAWISAGLVLVSTLQKPVQNLLIVIFPLALLSIIFVQQFPGLYLIDTGTNLFQLVHVLLSTVAFSILGVAALQALLMFAQDLFLRKKRPGRLLRLLPPVETMEILLFEITTLGFILLSFVLVLGLIFYGNVEVSQLSHSPYLAILAWIVFAILLWGHYRLGWRGRTAVRWTVCGVFILTASYFGNWLLVGILY